MQYILDLHIHSPYSRACSPQLTFKNIEKTCLEKGVNIIATGDFTHPLWFRTLKNELEETCSNSGLYKLKKFDSKVKFILSSEVCLIYKDEIKTRKIHLVILAPNLKAADAFNKYFGKKYNLKADGRPILHIAAPEFVRLVLKIDAKFLIYPAHIWTPWFGVLGSKSGFDSLKDCFKEEIKNIYAIETGLSSDPAMNWRLSALDRFTIISSSDAHSLPSIGREAIAMDLSESVTYSEIYQIIVNKNKKFSNKILFTIEFYPEEGKYYLDGHQKCGFSCQPKKGKNLSNICPICHKPLVIGVLNRVSELADRSSEFRPKKAIPFKKLIKLDKIIAEALGVKNCESLRVKKEYHKLIDTYGSELFILLELDLNNLLSPINKKVLEGIERVRSGNLIVTPGFDGLYGQINIFKK